MTEYKSNSSITVKQDGNEILIVVELANNDYEIETSIANQIVLELKPLLESMLKIEHGIVESQFSLLEPVKSDES